MPHKTSHRVWFFLIAIFGWLSMLHIAEVTSRPMPISIGFGNLQWDSWSFLVQDSDTSMPNNTDTAIIEEFFWKNDTPLIGTCINEPDIQFFMYHYVRTHDSRDNAATRDLSIDPRDFRAHMTYIDKLREAWKISTMNGEDFLKALATHCFPSKNIWIFTSDDAWSDTYTGLFPIAREYRVPFFLGVIANRIDTPGFVTSKEVVEISRDPLFTITSHSMTHGQQNTMSKEIERYEICESKKFLEQLIQNRVLTYIYPEGRMSVDSRNLVQECGYSLAWSTGFGKNWNPKNPSRFDINRNRIHSTTTIELFKKLSKWYQ